MANSGDRIEPKPLNPIQAGKSRLDNIRTGRVYEVTMTLGKTGNIPSPSDVGRVLNDGNPDVGMYQRLRREGKSERARAQYAEYTKAVRELQAAQRNPGDVPESTNGSPPGIVDEAEKTDALSLDALKESIKLLRTRLGNIATQSWARKVVPKVQGLREEVAGFSEEASAISAIANVSGTNNDDVSGRLLVLAENVKRVEGAVRDIIANPEA